MLHPPRPVKLPATVAVMDCGTNSILLLVARLKSKGKVTLLHQAIASPRLGEGLTNRGRLNPKAVSRTLFALKKLKKQAERFKPDFFLTVGTNAFRRAPNGRATARQFGKKLGIPFLVLSPLEEARLEFLGAASGLKTGSKVVVVDVGGGSSEIIWGKGGKITRKLSLEIGAVRLKEKFPRIRTYGEEARRIWRLEIHRKISRINPRKNYPSAVLTGGTATALAALLLGLRKYENEKVHGYKTTPEKLNKMLAMLSPLNLGQRKKALSFDPARSDIILSGGVLLLKILERLKVEKVIISDRGLRWGVLHSYFS